MTELLGPFPLLTTTGTVAAAWGGVAAVICVPDPLTLHEVAGMPSKVTPEQGVPVKPLPLIVTIVPPAVVPLVGLMEVMVAGWGPSLSMIVTVAVLGEPVTHAVRHEEDADREGAVCVVDRVLARPDDDGLRGGRCGEHELCR